MRLRRRSLPDDAECSALHARYLCDRALATASAAAEIRAALRLTRRAADAELSLALDLRHRLPRVWRLLAAGDIDWRRARVITYGTAHLTIGAAGTWSSG